jgi:hypothetical protein
VPPGGDFAALVAFAAWHFPSRLKTISKHFIRKSLLANNLRGEAAMAAALVSSSH